MAREIFKPPSRTAATGKLSVDLGDLPQERRTLFEPGAYSCRVEKCGLTTKRFSSNVSVILELRELTTGEAVDMRALWIAGPRQARGTMAARNRQIVTDLLAAIGVSPDSYSSIDDDKLTLLQGRAFDLDLGIDQGNAGGTFNVINRVNGEIDVTPLKPGGAE